MTSKTEATATKATKFQVGDYVRLLPFEGRKATEGEDDNTECFVTDSEGHENIWPEHFDRWVGGTYQVVVIGEAGYFVFPGSPDGLTEDDAAMAAFFGAPYLGLLADWLEPSTKEAFEETRADVLAQLDAEAAAEETGDESEE